MKKRSLKVSNRICFEYNQKNDNFEKIDCNRQAISIKTCEDIDLYELYKNLRKHFEEFSQKETEVEAEKGEYVKINTQQQGKLNQNIPINLLLKGVPGTGKSRLLDKIIEEDLKIKDKPENILRINIHSAITNAELMQGIGMSTTEEGNILYLEKEGLVLNHIKKAIQYPYQPFVLILEEIQENSLNELIGDLIYLIEEDKRTDLREVLDKARDKGINLEIQTFNDITELVDFLIKKGLIDRKQYIKIPYLVENKTEYRPLIFPKNLYVFCTSNYREDKKIMEDNLLRRFTIIELYPKKKVIQEQEEIPEEIKELIGDFFESLNNSILEILKEEIHPDRYLIGHAIFLNVNDKKSFSKALIKVIVEFKDLKELEFETVKEILNKPLELIKNKIEETKSLFELESSEIENLLNAQSYKELIDILQNMAYEDLLNK